MGTPRVLMLSRQYPREGHRYAGIFIHQQARHLTELGCEVRVVSPLPWYPTWLSAYANQRGFLQESPQVEMDGVQVYYPRYLRIPLGQYSHILTPFLLHIGVRTLIHQLLSSFHPEILHAHWAIPEGYAALLVREITSLPTIVNLHGSDIHSLAHANRPLRSMTKKVLLEADAVTAVSGAIRKQAEELGVPDQTIQVIYNSCDTDKFHYLRSSRTLLRQTLNIPEDHQMLIFIGSILKSKGIWELLEVMERIRKRRGDIHLVMIGTGKDEALFDSRSLERGLQEIIHRMGHRKHNEIPEWLSAADVLVLPSYNEGLPNVVLEAMACERPVIATRVGGIPEAVGDGVTGILVPPKDVTALDNAIERLLEDRASAQAMGIAGRRVVTSRFNWTRSTKAMLAVYKSLQAAQTDN